MQLENATRPRRRVVSLTPLIDVVFILLVFFMLASSFTHWRSLQLSVPADVSAPAEDRASPLVVRVGPDELRLDGERLSLAVVSERVSEALANDPDRIAIVRPGDDVRLQRLVTVVEGLYAVGGSRISLQREE